MSAWGRREDPAVIPEALAEVGLPALLAEAEAPAAGVAPETVISYHRPPERLSPLPLFCPGALSPT